MMAAIFATYAALVWLVFAKLKLLRLSLPLAIVLASVGPLFAFYIILSMNNYHPSSTDARVFQRVVQITPHVTVPGRVQNVVVQPNTPVKTGDVLFTIDPRPLQFEVNRLQAALAAATQLVPQLKAGLDQAAAEVKRAEEQVTWRRPTSTGRRSSLRRASSRRRCSTRRSATTRRPNRRWRRQRRSR